MKRIPQYSNYSATTDGRVWTHNLRPGWLTQGIDKNGYVRYDLAGDNGKRKGLYAHQAVALTYIPNPDNKPHVNHLDHNKANNSIENLVWCTHLENIRHDWATGNRTRHFGNSAKINTSIARRIRILHGKGLTQVELSKKFGISQPTISQIILRKTWSTA